MGYSWILVIVYLCLVHILSKAKQGDTSLFIEKKSVEHDWTAHHSGSFHVVAMQCGKWEKNLRCGEENTSVSLVLFSLIQLKVDLTKIVSG